MRVMGVLVGLALVGVVTALVARVAQQITVPALDFAPLICADPIRFQRVSDSPGEWQPERNGYFAGNTILQANICAPGLLTIEGSGMPDGGAAPEITVSLDGEPLTMLSFMASRIATVEIPRSGRLSVAYLNFFYKSEVRLAVFRAFHLDAPGCQKLDISVPKDNGGGWVPNAGFATLVGSSPMTIYPCAPGTLKFQYEGRIAQGASPHLRISEGGQIVRILIAAEKPQNIEMHVEGPVTVTLLNPYAKELAHRKLFVSKIVFGPGIR